MMNTNTQSILLLTSYFAKSAKDGVKPLSPTEWGRFAQWLNEQGNTPADLLIKDPREALCGWMDEKISLERIEQLLGRGHALALALEKWSRVGIWVLTRSDASYPKLLKQHLRSSAPPVLFGCGNAHLLNQASVCVVGSRKACESDLGYARALGQRIAAAGLSVVSGGARGIDEAAMLGGLSHEGTVVGVMADSLLQAAMSAKWRQGLMSNNLVLVSPFYPEAAFNAGNAMARNKYLYCLSQAAVVVHSDTKGGTWNGALENLKKSWVPLWVRRNEDAQSGNRLLVAEGGQWLDGEVDQLDMQALCLPPGHAYSTTPLPLLKDSVALDEADPVERADIATETVHPVEPVLAESVGNAPGEQPERSLVRPELSFYQLFLQKMECHGRPATIDELVAAWDLPKTLVNAWLKQSVDEGMVQKLGKPVRYQFLPCTESASPRIQESAPETTGQLGLGLD